VDPSCVFSPSDGLQIDINPGNYKVQAKVLNYGSDLVISRVRVILPGIEPEPGVEIGRTRTDIAMIGICDPEAFQTEFENQGKAAWDRIEGMIFAGKLSGIAELNKQSGAVMPFVSSGSSDGEYPVFDLVDGGKRVGIEVQFNAVDLD
jgi:hypothetical protein